jgi:hypothetical protein
MLDVEKMTVPNDIMYKDASIQHQLYNTNEIVRAAQGE